MTGTKAAERLRIERDLLGDARRAVLAGDLEAELLARHVLSWPPLAGRLARTGSGLVHPRDSSAAKRVLAGLLRRG